MSPFKHILIPTDFSLCAEAAFRHALYLAQHYGAEVCLLHVAAGPLKGEVRRNGAAEDGVLWPDQVVEAGPSVDAAHGHHVSLHRAIVQHPDPAVAILDYAQAHGVDLIVMGTHGDRGAGHFLSIGSTILGQTAEQVVRHAPCPVFRVGMRNGRSPDRVRCVLVPVDQSSLSLLALDYALDLAACYDARLDLLQVVEPDSPFAGSEPEEQEQQVPASVRKGQARAALVTAFEKMNRQAVPVDFHVVQGRPDREIRTFAERHAIDLIVLGAHSDVGRDVLGRVAEQVVRTAPCPVFTVRNPEVDRSRLVHHKGVFPGPSIFL